jgi:hypothetical protein
LNPETQGLGRRSARTLLSRADVAERSLGHAIGGTYDRYEFQVEKARAFELLAAQIEGILNPENEVVGSRGRRR